MADSKKIHMVTAVWGEWHLDALLEINFPSLLAPGNLPEFTRHHEVTYQIDTRRSDIARIEASPAFREIAKLMKVRIKAALPEQGSEDIFKAHHQSWAQAYERAKQDGMYVFNMPPDVAFADGSFAHLLKPLAAGKKSINWTHSRAVSDTFMPALKERYGNNGTAMVVPPREMVKLNLEHLHPLTICSSPACPYFIKHYEIMMWPVEGEGILFRVLASVEHLFYPGHFKLNDCQLIDGDIDFDDIYHVDDSDDFFVVSLSPLGKDADWYSRDNKADPVSIGRWWLHFDSPANEFKVSHHVRWHYCEPTESLWREKERASDLLLSRAAAAREGMRVARTLRENGCAIAASMVSLAVEMGFMPRAFPRPAAAIIFAPADKALEHMSAEDKTALLTGDGGRRLIRFLRHHVVIDDAPHLPLGERLAANGMLALTSATGHSVAIKKEGSMLTVNGIEVMSDIRPTGPHAVYEIGGILDDELE